MENILLQLKKCLLSNCNNAPKLYHTKLLLDPEILYPNTFCSGLCGKVCFSFCQPHSLCRLHVCNCALSLWGRVVCMEQCESAAALLESVREQEVQFEQLTRALEEERRRAGLSATSPSALGCPLPYKQVKQPAKVYPRRLPQTSFQHHNIISLSTY